MFKYLLKNCKIQAILLAILLIMTSACSRSNEANNNIDVKTPEPSASSEPEEIVLPEDNINSHAGAPQDDASLANQNTQEEEFVFPKAGVRPFAVMIDNEGTKCLPQGGLNMAQVIYEIIVEGGVSRLMPVFWEREPELVGPVRSSRHYFLDYAMEHDAVYVHFGWSPMAITDISKFKINNINGVANGGEIFWDLTNDKRNWQDSYTSTSKIKGYIQKAKYKTNTDKELVFKYNEKDAELQSENTTEKINIRYSTGYSCGYTYDHDNKVYLRLRQNQPQIERVTQKQLTAKNIIIQRVKNYTIKGDQYGRQEVNTVGSGEGYYITNGKYIEIKWSKASRTERTIYTDADGNEIHLNPGQTWVQIVPKESKIDL